MGLHRPSVGYQLVMGLVAFFMISLLIDAQSQFWHMPLPARPLFQISLVAVAYGWIWWRSRWVGFLLSLLSGFGLLWAIRNSPTLTAWVIDLGAEALSLFYEIRGGNWEATFETNFGLVGLVLTAVLAGLLIIWEGFGRGSAFWTIVSGLFFFGIQWSWFFDRATSFFVSFVFLALVLWTLGQAGLRDARWLASGRRISYRSRIGMPLLAVFATTVMGSILPADFDAINMGSLGERIQEAFPVLKQLRGGGVGSFGGRFSLAATGFSPYMNRLGGPVQLDERVALHLSSTTPIAETLYLRGATFLDYTGSSWEFGESPELRLPENGLLPSQYPSAVLKESIEVKVTPALNFGRTIFNILEPDRVKGLPNGYEADAEGNLSALGLIPRNSSYTIMARLPRYSAEQIRQMTKPTTDEELSRYLQRPDQLPPEIRYLAQKLADGAGSPYDAALAIESFLHTWEYDLNPPPTPEGRDFVAHFLFDLQRGYCTYYATAMTVMLRELEIPTRLVEGFAVPASSPYTEDEAGVRTYPVLNSQAHAWVEAFFPGYGWVTFDPTPRADLPVIARNTPAPTTVESPTPQTDPGSVQPPMPEDEFMDPGYVEELGPSTPTGPKREIPWFLGPLLLLGALVLSLWRYLQRQDRFQATEDRSLVQEAWEKAGGLLARFGFGPAPHQTPREYADQLGKAVPPLQEQALQVAEDYTKARYGPDGAAVDVEAWRRARGFWQRAKSEMFDRYGWRTYLWRRLRRRTQRRTGA